MKITINGEEFEHTSSQTLEKKSRKWFKRRRKILVVNPHTTEIERIRDLATLPIIMDFTANPSIQVKKI